MYLWKLVKLYVDWRSQSSAEVARTRTDETETLTPRELMTFLLHRTLDLQTSYRQSNTQRHIHRHSHDSSSSSQPRSTHTHRNTQTDSWPFFFSWWLIFTNTHHNSYIDRLQQTQNSPARAAVKAPESLFTGGESLNASKTSSSHIPTKFSQLPDLHTFITAALLLLFLVHLLHPRYVRNSATLFYFFAFICCTYWCLCFRVIFTHILYLYLRLQEY